MENQLQTIIKNSNLDKTKADYILENFTSYFSIAAEWEKRAKNIVVTDAGQTDIMKLARVGRLALKDKRITLEKERKSLKEQSLREGKAIDGIANVLKAVIIPIEEYLEKQEHFVAIKEAEEAKLAKIEQERMEEAERVAREKAEKEEQERIIIENEKLKKEAEKRERKIVKEKAEYEAKIKADREEAEKKQREIEEIARKEQEKQNAIIEDQKAKAEAERQIVLQRENEVLEKALKEKQALENKLKAKAEAERQAIEEKKELEKQLKNMITCPKCGHEFNK